MAEQRQKMHFPKLDDLFTTEEERVKNNSELITEIDISNIDNFPDHPFKVIENEELLQMSESIKEKGVIVPALVRPKEDGTKVSKLNVIAEKVTFLTSKSQEHNQDKEQDVER